VGDLLDFFFGKAPDMLLVLVHGGLGGPPVELGRGLPKRASHV
jgi:hypothetical protein